MNRKALIRAYKEAKRPMGVFQVRNLAEGKSLIGTSRDLPAMLNRQLAQLRLGAHPSRELQDDWKRLGPDGFSFATLDELEPAEDEPKTDPAEELALLETMWREKLAASGERFYER